MAINATFYLSGLARKLINDGKLSQENAIKAQEESQKAQLPLVSYLVENNLVNSRDIATAASEEFGIPLFDIQCLDLENAPIKLVEEKLIQQHHALPIAKRGNRLFVAVSDPTNLQALDEIKFHAGINTDAILVEEASLKQAIDKALNAQSSSGMEDLDADLEGLEVSSGEEADSSAQDEAEEAPVVRFVNKILLDAINRGASDIHFEPYEKIYRVRLRQDGILRQVASPPIALTGKIAARIKVMSQMDIAEKRKPQDGRIKLKLSAKRAIDFRVNSCPTLFGEKLVLRILDPTSAQLGIDALGYEPIQKQRYLDALSKPYGMILVTGPTGSGKTVSLYTGLNILNKEDVNISTAEDPAEINLPGINQCNMNPKAGLTFASALKAFLRQDPDIIMIGEIRDLETAEIAIKAAQTGHMVMSTLHTNDAPQTLTRLAQIGIPAFNIASAVNLIIAQRLARRLCKHCKQKIDIPKHALLQLGFKEEAIATGLEIYKAVGCDQCTDGYKGRVGIYQVMPITEKIQVLIMEGANSMVIGQQAQAEGILDIRQSALLKVQQGLTSMEEINRVTKE